jgi:retinol dehydrogenase 12
MNHLMKKTVVVTGATSGIGYQTALDFARRGDFVIGVGRNTKRCSDAQMKILETVPGARIRFLTADLGSQQQIKSLAAQIEKLLDENHFTGLDVLVNNAGLYMGKKEITADGIETTFAVNHIAPFLLTNLLMTRLASSPDSRVITVSSDSHYHTRLNLEKAKNPGFFFGLWAYQESKLANILFSLELNRLNKRHSPHAFAVDPGLVNTEIGAKKTGWLANLVWRYKMKKGKSPEIPAKTILFLADDLAALNSTAVYWHDCKPKIPSQEALIPNSAHLLWIESCKLCGIPLPQEGELS